MLLAVILISFVCFLPVYSGRQVRLGIPAGVSQEKVIQDFSSTFFLRCMPYFSRGGFVRSFPSSKFVHISGHVLHDSTSHGLYHPYKRFVTPLKRRKFFPSVSFPQSTAGYVIIPSVCVFSSHSFWTLSSLDIPAGVTQKEGLTGFLIHLLSAVRALSFLARRIQPFLSLVDREVEFCVPTI